MRAIYVERIIQHCSIHIASMKEKMEENTVGIMWFVAVPHVIGNSRLDRLRSWDGSTQRWAEFFMLSMIREIGLYSSHG